MKNRWFAFLAAAGLAFALTAGTAQAAKEIRIGLIVPMTGIFAQIGKDMSNGFNMYLAQNKGMMGPVKVKLIREDSTGKP